MASEATTTAEGSLERLHISVSTTAPDDLLTPNAVRAVRFRKSKPWGILEQDVKDFQEIVTAAIAWYIEKLHSRDMDVYKLGKELDGRDTQITNLNLQLASAQYNSGVKEAIDRNEEDKEMSDLLNRVADLQAQLDQSNRTLAQADLDHQQLTAELAAAQAAAPVVPTMDAEVTAGVDPETLAAAEQELADTQARLLELETANKGLEVFIDQQEAYIDTLLTQLEVTDSTTPDAPESEEPLTAADDAYVAQDEDEVGYDVAPTDDVNVDDDPEFALHPYEQPEDDNVDEAEEPLEDEPEDQLVYEDPTPVPAAPKAPTPQHNPGDEAYVYNGIKLPPGIRPEDL